MNWDWFPLSEFEVDCDGSACGSDAGLHVHPLAEVEEANDRGDLVDWTLVHSACPSCGRTGVVEVRQLFVTEPLGTFSLAGFQMKVTARITWVYRCTSCGAKG